MHPLFDVPVARSLRKIYIVYIMIGEGVGEGESLRRSLWEGNQVLAEGGPLMRGWRREDW